MCYNNGSEALRLAYHQCIRFEEDLIFVFPAAIVHLGKISCGRNNPRTKKQITDDCRRSVEVPPGLGAWEPRSCAH